MISNDDDKASFLLLDSIAEERLDARISLSQISKLLTGSLTITYNAFVAMIALPVSSQKSLEGDMHIGCLPLLGSASSRFGFG
jgi:hypothetical protein